MTVSVTAALIVGDVTSLSSGGVAEMDVVGAIASQTESTFDKIIKDTPLGSLKQDLDLVFLIPNTMNNFHQCMSKCQTTLQDKIFRN